MFSSRGCVIGPTFNLSVSDLNFGVVAFGKLLYVFIYSNITVFADVS